jgi:L-asparagine oxygenase
VTTAIRYTVADQDRSAIVRAHEAYPPPVDERLFIRDAYCFGCRYLPAGVLSVLFALSNDTASSGVAVLDNLPIGELGATPRSDEEYFTERLRDRLSERLLLAVGEQIGVVYAYANERNGTLIANVVPTESARGIQSSNGSARLLPLHTEDLHQYPYTPDFVVLLCLREEDGQDVYTHVLETRGIIDALSPRVRSTLQRPLFVTTPPPIYGTRVNHTVRPIPVIEGGSPSYKLQVEFNDTRALTRQGEQALAELKDCCATAATVLPLKLRAGEMAILDNNKVLHGRAPFTSSFGPERRWLQRAKVKAGNLWPWRHLVESFRVIEL